MSSLEGSSSIVWQGRPWIAPAAAARSIVVIIVGLFIIWIEFYTGIANTDIFGLTLALWTVIALLIIWLLSLTGLLIQRATNLYTLRSDSLEIRTGILTSRSFLVVASGFSDLEVIRGVIGRIIEYGDITIRTQNEKNPEETLSRVRNPLKVADQIRYVMGRPIVRIEQKSEPKP